MIINKTKEVNHIFHDEKTFILSIKLSGKEMNDLRKNKDFRGCFVENIIKEMEQ